MMLTSIRVCRHRLITSCYAAAARTFATRFDSKYFDLIPKDALTVSFARSGGKGGQNVNKVNTKVDIRFHLDNATWLEERVRNKLRELHGNRINRDGEFIVTSELTRTQKGNFEDAVKKLREFIIEASAVPKETSPEQKLAVEKLKSRDNERRLEQKKFLKDKKAGRRKDW